MLKLLKNVKYSDFFDVSLSLKMDLQNRAIFLS